jgi:enoyl-CoA hydratase/carnithine racemase
VGSFVQIETRGQVAEVILRRPPVNAVSLQVYQELIEAFTSFAHNNDVHCVLLRSDLDGRFSAGADLKEAGQGTATESAMDYRQRLAREAYEAILDCAVPTIAAVNGFALGAGLVMAACCDVRIAATTATFALPEIKVGRCGGGRHLMRLVPQGQARLMYFTGEAVTADQARAMGLVEQVVEPSVLLDSARALAASIASNSPMGLRMAKEALNACEAMPVREGYREEQKYTIALGKSRDAIEAAAAVMEKRKPVWNWPER